MILPDYTVWYQDTYPIYHKDVDFREELRFSALAIMLQETAWAHARVMGIDYSQGFFQGYIWVLSRLDIEFVAPMPKWASAVQLYTSPVGIEKLFALRDFVACTEQAIPFAVVRSSWLIIDQAKRTLVRPSILGKNFEDFYHPPVRPEPAAKLEGLVDLGGAKKIAQVGYHDIDGHQHVNNVRYFDWCTDLYPLEWHRAQRLVRATANFTKEMDWGQEVWHSQHEHRHYIRCGAQGEIAATIQYAWEPR